MREEHRVHRSKGREQRETIISDRTTMGAFPRILLVYRQKREKDGEIRRRIARPGKIHIAL